MSEVVKCGHGEGYSSCSGRPQTVPFLRDSSQLLDVVIPIDGSKNGQKSPPFYGIMHLVLHINFDTFLFTLNTFED